MLLSKSGLHLGWVKLVIIYSAWGEVLRKQDAGLDWTSPISKKLVYFLNYFIFIWTAAMRAGELGRWCPQRQRQGSLWILSKKLQWCWLSLVALVGGWRASAVSLSSVGTAKICFSGGNKLTAFDRNWGVWNRCSFGFFSPELLDENSTWRCRRFISNTDIKKLFLSLSSSLPYSCFIQTQPKWTTVLQETSLLLCSVFFWPWRSLSHWSRGAAAVT